MPQYYVRPDPVTFDVVVRVDDRWRERTLNLLKKLFRKATEIAGISLDLGSLPCAKWGELLNRFSDLVVEEIRREVKDYFKYKILGEGNSGVSGVLVDLEQLPFAVIPADTRFPGFTNSLGEHLLTTSAFAVSVGLSLFDKRGIRAPEYNLDECLRSREFVRGFIRTASLLHDVGKMPPVGHAERTKKVVRDLFGDNSVGIAISEAASRHHYRRGLADELTPRNDVEWIVAFADKMSASSRSMLIKPEGSRSQEVEEAKAKFRRLVEYAKRFRGIGYSTTELSDLEEMERLLNGERISEEEDAEGLRTYGFLSPNEEDALTLNRRLIEAERQLGAEGEKLISLVYFEIPSIKGYLSRGRSLKVYAGYSLMIDAVNHRFSRLISEIVGPEAVISDEGGAVLALVPSTLREEELERRFTDREKRLRFFAWRLYKEEFLMAEMLLGPREVWRGVTGQGVGDPYARDIVRSFGTTLAKFLRNVGSKGTIRNVPSGGDFDADEACEECKVRPRTVGKRLCEACQEASELYEKYRGLIMGLRESEYDRGEAEDLRALRSYSLFEELTTLRESFGLKVQARVPLTFDEWKGKSSDSWIWFVAGDGDNFGHLKTMATTLSNYLGILNVLSFSIYYSIIYGITESSKSLSRERSGGEGDSQGSGIDLVPLLLGGDDFVFAVRGDQGPFLLYYMDEALRKLAGESTDERDVKGEDDAAFVRRSKPYLWFGISTGVYSTKDLKFPYFLGVERAEELQGFSKGFSKGVVRERKLYGAGLIVTASNDRFFGVNMGGAEESYYPMFMVPRGGLRNFKELASEYCKARGFLDVKKMRKLIKIGRNPLTLSYEVIRSAGNNAVSTLLPILRLHEKFGGAFAVKAATLIALLEPLEGSGTREDREFRLGVLCSQIVGEA